MKRLLGILLVVVLVVPLLAAGCASDTTANENGGGIEFQLPTPSPSPVGGEEGVTIEWQPGATIIFQLATPTPTPGPGEGEVILTVPPGLGEEWVIGPIEPPEPGDTVVIMLNCEARAEELIILSQYLELRGYIADINAEPEAIYQAWLSFLRWVGVPLSWLDVCPNLGTVTGILQVEADTVLTLPFVTNIRVVEAADFTEILEEFLGALLARDVDALNRVIISFEMAGE